MNVYPSRRVERAQLSSLGKPVGINLEIPNKVSSRSISPLSQSDVARCQVEANAARAVFIDNLVSGRIVSSKDNLLDVVSQDQLSILYLLCLRHKNLAGENIEQELEKLPKNACHLLECTDIEFKHFFDEGGNVYIPELDLEKLSKWIFALEEADFKDRLSNLVNEVLPIINPKGRDLSVYYYACGSDLLPVLASTDATRIIFLDLSKHPMKNTNLSTNYFEEVIQQIKNLATEVEDIEITEEQPVLLDQWDEGRLIDFMVAINNGNPKDGTGFQITQRNRDFTCQEMSENRFHIKSQDGKDDFIIEINFPIEIKILQSDGYDFPEGTIPFAFQDERHIGKLRIKFKSPSITGEIKDRELIFHLGDAHRDIPEELNGGYDVLWSTDHYVFKRFVPDESGNKDVRERLIKILNRSGKIVFRQKKITSNPLEGTILHYPHVDQFQVSDELPEKLFVATKTS